jgi:DNA-binding HxlR family transcriptional regulator
MPKVAEKPPETADSVCPSRHLHAGVGLLQEKWVLLIVKVLLSGPQGFNDVARNTGDVNSTTLAQRLGRLEKAGIVSKTVQSVMPPKTSYALTDAGMALKPTIDAIETWAVKYGLACEVGKDDAA